LQIDQTVGLVDTAIRGMGGRSQTGPNIGLSRKLHIRAARERALELESLRVSRSEKPSGKAFVLRAAPPLTHVSTL
jgi:hypothetical protein